MDCIKQTIQTRRLKEEVFKNVNPGPKFVPKSYFEFINNQPFIIRSHSNAHTPTDNAVVEKMHHTLKNKVKQ